MTLMTFHVELENPMALSELARKLAHEIRPALDGTFTMSGDIADTVAERCAAIAENHMLFSASGFRVAEYRPPRDLPWEDPVPDFRIAYHERASLARLHEMSYFYPQSDEDFDAGLEPRRREHPVCRACGEFWGKDGCRTLRMIAALASALLHLTGLKRRLLDQREAIAQQTSVRWRINRARRTWELSYLITEEALLTGGKAVVEHSLVEVREQMRRKFDDLNKPSMGEAMAKALALGMADQARRDRQREREP